MFDIGFSELLLLGAIALIVIGPKQLPDVARAIARLVNELKRATGDIGSTVLDIKSHSDDLFKNTQSSITKAFLETSKEAKSAKDPKEAIPQAESKTEDPTMEESKKIT